MSWLTDLAGKAENLLNKIDQNAAVVLKDKNLINEQLQDVIWKTAPKGWTQDSESLSSNRPITAPPPLPRSAPSGAPSPARRPSPSRADHTYLKRNEDDDLLRFLNSSESLTPGTEDARGSPSGASVPSAGSSSPVNMVDIPSRSHSRNHSQGGMSSMSSSYMSSGRDDPLYQQCFKPVEGNAGYSQEDEVNISPASELLAENNLLKNEIRCLNNELSLLLQRSKAAEKEVHTAGQELRTLRQTLTQNEQLESQLQLLQSQLIDNEKAIMALSSENEKLKENCEGFSTHDSANAQELSVTLERLKQLEAERESMSQEATELRLQILRLQATVADAIQQNERYRVQLTAVTTEAEQYRARATRVLQEKEKLITSLQSAKQIEGESSSSVVDQEVEQLREELQLVRQECASQLKLLQSARYDLQECELQQEEHRQKSETEIDRLQKKLGEERSQRLAAEEDCRSHSDELQLAKQEMNYQCDHLKECLRRKESELTQLKQQAQTSSNTSQTSNGSAELESRIRSLATSLIQKQGALEALIAERNSLRLKLERFENQTVPTSVMQNTSLYNGGTVLNVNENDNVTRLRVPTLLSENPGDTGVARRVKRAYSSLDTLGIRVGVFLRRYPLARILVILYMVLLHLWVAVVLFNYSPEGQSSVATMKNPPAIAPEEPNGVH